MAYLKFLVSGRKQGNIDIRGLMQDYLTHIYMRNEVTLYVGLASIELNTKHFLHTLRCLRRLDTGLWAS